MRTWVKKVLAATAVMGFVLLPLQQANAAFGSNFLTLNSPNGGERFVAGHDLKVTWSSPLSSDSSVNATLYKLKGTHWDPQGDFYTDVENSYSVTFDQFGNTGYGTWEIPFDQPAGNYALELSINYSERFSNMYAVAYSTKPFQIVAGSPSADAPMIESVTPSPIYIGGKATITGSNFKTDSEVYLRQAGVDYPYNITVKTEKITPTQIIISLDQYVYGADYLVYVHTSRGTSEGYPVTVTQSPTPIFPFITSVSPQRGPAGTWVTITGGNFTDSNDINYYPNDYYPYPIPTEDGKGDSTAAGGSGEGGGSSGDSKIFPPIPPIPQPIGGNITGIKSEDGTTLKFQLPSDLLPSVYTLNVSNEIGTSDEGYFTVIDPNSTGVHPQGTNVLGPDGTVYFIDSGRTRSPYASATAFLSYRFNTWADVLPATAEDMNLPLTKYVPVIGPQQETTYYVPPRSGSLVNDHGTIYLISNGQRAAFTSAKVFLAAGYSFANVVKGDTSFMITLLPITTVDRSHAEGTLINDNGTFYVIKNGYRLGIPSMGALESWGYAASEAVPANDYDRKVESSGVIGKRSPGQLNI